MRPRHTLRRAGGALEMPIVFVMIHRGAVDGDVDHEKSATHPGVEHVAERRDSVVMPPRCGHGSVRGGSMGLDRGSPRLRPPIWMDHRQALFSADGVGAVA